MQALRQLNETLLMYMDAEKIVLLLDDQIQLTSGKILPLSEQSLFFSLTYPTAPARIFEMELSAPPNTTLH